MTVLLAACATPANKPQPAAAAGTDAKQPFITRSAIFFPDTTADLELYQKYAYPDAPNGVQITYRSKTLPDARIDFFVFALGRGPQDQGLKIGDERMRAEIQGVAKAGVYSDLVFNDDADFPVTAADGSKLVGRRLLLTMSDHGWPDVSAGYMFYKQLYLMELRITAPAAAGDTLRQVGDQAAQQVVPLIHILSEGGCEHLTINWDPNSGPNGLLAAMQKASDEHVEVEGCPAVTHTPEDFKPKTGEDVLMVNYKPTDW